jgi:hypothetical protein
MTFLPGPDLNTLRIPEPVKEIPLPENDAPDPCLRPNRCLDRAINRRTGPDLALGLNAPIAAPKGLNMA